MTTRKYNMIQKNVPSFGPATFEAILGYLKGIEFDFDKYTAKQIAEVMLICKAQNEMGFDKGYKEALCM